MKEKEITNQDLFDLIKSGFDSNDERFESMDKRFESMDKRFDAMDKRLTRVESLMVTKDYLDDKLADLKGDLVVLTRKEDTKLKTLVNILA